MQEIGIKKKLYFYNEKQFAKVTKLNKKIVSRNSPLFSIYPQKKQTPPLHKNCFVTFLFPRLSFQSIGQIINQVDDDVQRNIWFSNGLSSIVIFSEDESAAEIISDLLENQVSAIEKWCVNRNTIDLDKCGYELKPSATFDAENFQVHYETIENNPEILNLLNEFTLSMNRLVNLSAQYSPALLFTLKSIASNIQELIDELSCLIDLKNGKIVKELPPSLVKKNANVLLAENNGIQKRIFQRVGSIIEIVSTISYIDSQAFGCVAPLLNNNFRISSNSLLGVGSAYLGIIGFTQFVEKRFSDFPVTKVIDNFFHEMKAFDCKNLFSYNSDLWGTYDFNLDDKFQDIEKNSIKSSLIYLSLRLGFKETSNTISSPWQVVPFGDSVPWSLMTLSHELLHSHVRSILGAIFKCPEDETTENWFKKLCLNYQNTMQSGTEKENSLLDSIRIMIFEYCVYIEERSSVSQDDIFKAKEKGEKVYFNLEEQNSELILERLSGYFKNINELFVHVLDYHYFYDCNPELYIGLLWESWSTVPAVLQDIRIYLLRTMIAIGTEVKSDPVNRFKDTTTIFLEHLKQIDKRCDTNETIKKALAVLEDKERLPMLENLFDISIFLADMVNHLLCSKNIYSSIVADSDKGPDGDQFYDLETGYFEDSPIQSPVAFVLDRLRFSLNKTESDLSIEYRSAWLLHACASNLDHKFEIDN